MSPSAAVVKLESKESREERPARVSFEDAPPGFRNSSNFLIAPLLFAKSRACRIWVVEFQEGPSICLAINRHAAVLPTPEGPAKIR